MLPAGDSRNTNNEVFNFANVYMIDAVISRGKACPTLPLAYGPAGGYESVMEKVIHTDFP